MNHTGLTDCQSCHLGDRPPNHYQGQCSQCHNTTNWGDATFEHTFPINHHGANGVCSKCHPGGDTSQWTCAGCHNYGSMDNKHRNVNGYSHNCIQCHADGGGDAPMTLNTLAIFVAFQNPALRTQPSQRPPQRPLQILLPQVQ